MITQSLERLTKYACAQLRTLGFRKPTEAVLHALIDCAYMASIKTEENRFVKGSLTYSDPKKPELDSPICRRADYPSFTPLGRKLRLEARALVKLFRAVDRWSGSIAVFGTKTSDLFIWGIVDQQVQRNVRINLEAEGGFIAPGIVTINIDGIGEISISHGDLFLGRLRQNQILTSESDPLDSNTLLNRVAPAFLQEGAGIAVALGDREKSQEMACRLFFEWGKTIARICIGLRRLGTGGSLLITPTPVEDMLDIGYSFKYNRLRDATILNLLDSRYENKLAWADIKSEGDHRAASFAQADAEDRASELMGAIKIVTSLAAVDGLVLMDLKLGVLGFGVKIKNTGIVRTVYEGEGFVRKRQKPMKIETKHFGTRHLSMLRYCKADRNAIGVVISQDGETRLITSIGKSLILWENVKLLGYQKSVKIYAEGAKRHRKAVSENPTPRTLGFTDTPKTLSALLALAR